MNRKLFGDERGRAIKIDSIRPQEVSGKASKGLNWKVRSALESGSTWIFHRHLQMCGSRQWARHSMKFIITSGPIKYVTITRTVCFLYCGVTNVPLIRVPLQSFWKSIVTQVQPRIVQQRAAIHFGDTTIGKRKTSKSHRNYVLAIDLVHNIRERYGNSGNSLLSSQPTSDVGRQIPFG